MEVEWNKVTENSPPEGRDLLVWTGHYMMVSEAYYYDEKARRMYADMVLDPRVFNGSEKERLHYMNCRGYFQEFGHKSYFDNPKIYWAELPNPPETK